MISYRGVLFLEKVLKVSLLIFYSVVSLGCFFLSDPSAFPIRFLLLTIIFLMLSVIILLAMKISKVFIQRKTAAALMSQCDPLLYLEKITPVLKGVEDGTTYLVGLQYCKVLAYAFSDKNGEAHEALLELIDWYQKGKKKSDLAHKLVFICAASKTLTKEEIFRKYFEELGSLLKDTSLKNSYIKNASEYYTDVLKKQSLIDNEDYESLIRWINLQEKEMNSGDMFSLVRFEYEKADYLEKVRDFEGARRSLEFVIEHGNKLNYVEKARKRLDSDVFGMLEGQTI